MQEQLSEVLFYVKGTLKYKWLIIVVAWLISSAGWVFVSKMPDMFQSKAVVNVDSSTMLRPLLRRMTVQADTRGLIHVMRKLMFTRPKLERVAELGGLELGSKNEAEKQSLLEKLKKGIKISGGKDDLFSISYDGANPQGAQNIVYAVLTVFSEQTQQRGISDTGNAQQFIDEQIREYEVRLRNAEKARENFMRVNSGLLPDQGGGKISQLDDINQQLDIAKMTLNEVSSREHVLRRQIDEALEGGMEWGMDDVMTGGHSSAPEDAQIGVLQERMNELLIQYTGNHPEVVSIKSQINDLLKSKQERLANKSEELDIMSSGAMANPYIQSLKVALNNIEIEKASIVSRIDLLSSRIADIKKGMDSRLRIETEMQNLDRDYSVIKGNFMNLIESRETAAMTAKADRSQGVLKFKIVDAPTAPLEPTGPNRKLFNSAFLIAGIVIGCALAFLTYFIRPTFMSTRQLRTVTGLPVLGSVAVQIEEGDRSNKRYNIVYGSLLVSLLLVYIIVMSIS